MQSAICSRRSAAQVEAHAASMIRGDFRPLYTFTVVGRPKVGAAMLPLATTSMSTRANLGLDSGFS